MCKNFVKGVLLLLALVMAAPIAVNAKGEKKEKKAYVWNWDKKLSGNQFVDDYLLSVDSIWYQMKEVNDLVDGFTYHEDTLTLNGKYYVAAYMTNTDGEYVTRGAVNWNFATVTLLSGEVVMKATLVGVQTANATMALPQLGLKALSYGKYVKGGPNVIALATTGVKRLWGITTAQAKRWNAMKKNSIKNPEALGIELTDKGKELLNKCLYVKEITKTSPEYQQIVEIQSKKSAEQVKQEADQFTNALANANIAPAEASKTLDTLDESELDKFAAEMN